MISPLDPFAERFDSIDIDRTQAPSAAVLDDAMAAAAPETEAPGFYLVDDAGGRFIVDRDLGVVSLKDAALLAAEAGAVHSARLKVIEPSGLSYELELRLRITGMVPQVADADEFAALAGLGASALLEAPPVAAASESAPVASVEPASAPIAWSAYFAAAGTSGDTAALDEAAGFGALLSQAVPAVALDAATLSLDDVLPAPSARGAEWAL